MKTDDLIGALAADAASRGAPVSWTLALAGVLGFGVIAALFTALLGARPDIGASMTEWRFLVKLGTPLVLAVAAARLAHVLVLPGRDARLAALGLVIAPLVVAVAVAMEFAALPASAWRMAAEGYNAIVCVMVVPLLSLPLLAGLLLALRRGAAAAPERAGAAAGLAAGGAAAFLYAMYCPNDSPFYLAIWYMIAIAIVALTGAVLGKFWLKW